MFCEKCGKLIGEGGRFCSFCGSPVSEELLRQHAKYAQSVNVAQNTTQDSNNVQDTNNANVERGRKQMNNQTSVQPPRPQQNPQVFYSQQSSQNQYVQQAPQMAYYPQAMCYNPGTHPYNNLGGFLMGMVVVNYIMAGLILLGCLIYLIDGIKAIDTISDYTGLLRGFYRGVSSGGVIAWLVFVYISNIMLCITSGVCMINYARKIQTRDPWFLYYIQKRSLWLMIWAVVFSIIAYVWGKKVIPDIFFKSGSILVSNIFLIICWLVGVVVGSVYFSSSVRVRTYMRTDAYLKYSLFNKNSIPPMSADDYYEKQVNIIDDMYRKKSAPAPTTTPLGASWTCPSCGETNTGTSRVCMACGNYATTTKPSVKPSESITGTGVSQWMCPECGQKNTGASGFCSGCGKYITSKMPVK